MSDQLVIDIDSKSVDIATGSLKAFEDAVGQVERTLKSSGGISALDELKKALGNVGTAADSLKRSFAGSVEQLGRIFKNEMAELKSIVQETGLGVGRAAAKGIEDGMAEAPAAIRKQGRTIAAAAKAEATRIYEAMVAGQANAKVKDVGSLFKLDEAGATLSPYHKQVLENWKKSSVETFRSMKIQLATERKQLEGQVKAENEALQSALKRMEDESKTRSASLTSIYRSSLARGNSSISQVRTALKAEAAQLQATVKSENDALQAALQSMEINSRDKAKSLAAIYRDSLGRGNFAVAQVKSRLKAESSELQAAVKAEESELQRALQAMEASDKLRKSSLAEIYAGSLKRGDQSITRVKAQLREQADSIIQANKTELERVKAQVAAATNNAEGPYQKYNPQSGIAGAVVDPKKIGQVNQLSKAFKQLTIDGNDAHSMARGLASGFNLLWLTWGNLAPLFAGASISFGVKKTFDIGSEVEYQIKMMEVLGQTVDETGKEFQGAGKVIRAELRAIDQETMFSLKELAIGMVDIQQTGRTTAEAIGMLRPAAALATVGQTTLKESTDLLTQTLSAFQVTAAKSGTVAAKLFQATKSSPLTIRDLSDSIKYASEVNVGYGQSLDEVLVLLGSLSKVNLKGTTGGTSVINFMRDVAGRSDPAIKALETLRKATGDTIAIMDKGKFRPIIDIMNDMGTALSKIKPDEAIRLLQRMASDRGIRAYFASIIEGTKNIDDMRVAMQKASEVDLFKAQKTLMDTSKGALELLKGALVGALDTVFEGFSESFKGAIVDMTTVINSPAFRSTVAGMVGAVMGLYDAVRTLSPALLALFSIWAGFKTLSFGVALFQGLAAAMTSVATATVSQTKAVAASTGGFAAQGAAAIGAAAAARATAAGYDTVTVAAIKSNAQTIALTGSMRIFASVAAFLANPLVGIVTTLAMVGGAYFASSRAADAAMGETSDSVLKNGKINVDQWMKEIQLLRIRQGLLGGDQISSQEKALNTARENLAKDEANLARLRRTGTNEEVEARLVFTGNTPSNAKRTADSAQRVLEKSIADQRAAVSLGAQSLFDLREEVADRDAKQAAEQERKAKEAAERLKGELGIGAPKAFGADRRTYQDTKIAIDNRLAEIVKGYNKEKEEARNAAADDKAMLDSKHKNGLISEGEYQSQLFNITKESEQKQLAQIKSSRDEYSAIYQGRIKELADQWLEAKSRPTKNEADRRAQQDDLNKIADAWENLGNTATTEIEKMDSDARQLASKGMRDLAIASDNAAGAIYKLRESERKYWADDKATLDKARALDAVNAKYRNLNDSVFSLDEANRAYEVAAAESTAKHEAHIEELTNSLNVAELAAQAFWDGAIGRGGFDTGEFARWLELKKVATDTGNAIADAKTKAGMSASAAGQAAFDRMRQQQNAQLASDLSDAVMTGLVEGGEQGKTKLRDLLVKELQKPVKMVINLMMNAAVNGVMGAVGLGGAGGGSGLVNAFNGLSAVKNAYGFYQNGIGSLTAPGSMYYNFATSGIGQSMGLSNAAPIIGNNPSAYMPAGTAMQTPGWMSQLGTAGAAFAAVTGLAAAFGAFRSERSVGGGLSGTFGAGDITGYDLRRESGYLFGGPDYTMVNPAQKIAELEAMRGKGTYLGGGWVGSEVALEQEIERLKVTYKDMLANQGAQSKALQTAYEVLRTSAGDMADSLGIGSWAVRNFTTTVGTDVIHPDTGGIGIKLDGLKPEEVQAKIQAALDTASNELAQQVIGSWETVTETVRNFAYEGFAFEDGLRLVETAPTVTQKSVYVASEFARDGEKAIDTLTRLSTNLGTVNAIWENLGYTMYEASLAGADAANKMADAFGGLENMTAVTGVYYENFYSDAEKAANVTRDITKALAKFGLEMPTTRAGYRALVEQQQKLGEAGTKSVVALMGLSGAFASITEQSSNLRDSLTEAYKEEVSRLEDLLKSYKAIGDNLLKLKEELTMGALSTATPAQKYEQARAVYEVTYQKALGGDVKAAEDFGNYASALLEQSRVMFASGSSYTSDFDKVLADIARIEDTNTDRVNDTQVLLKAANAQVTYLEGINSGVRTLVELIGDYSQQLTRSFGNTIAGDVITAYDEIGRSGFGTEVSQIDIAGFSHWLNVRKSTDSAGFFDLFGKAVASESYLVDDPSSMFGKSIPKFASGGYHSGGMRLVGENGPELEVTGPAMYYSSAQTAHLFGTAAQNSELAAELAALRQQVAELQEKLVEAVIDGAVMNARATEDNTKVVSNAVTETGSKSAYMEKVKRKVQR